MIRVEHICEHFITLASLVGTHSTLASGVVMAQVQISSVL